VRACVAFLRRLVEHMLTVFRRRAALGGQLPQVAAHVLRARLAPPPSALRAALCSSSGGSGSSSDSGNDGNGKSKPLPAKPIADAEADANAEADAIDADADAYPGSIVEDGGGETEVEVMNADVEDGEGGLTKYDPENISTMPPVVVLPLNTRPLFPGIFQPCEVTDHRLVQALNAAKASHHPYVGVFMPRDLSGKGESAVQPVADASELHGVGTLAQIMRLSPTPQGVQVLLVGGKRVTIDRVVATPGLDDARVLEVKVKEAKDEIESDGAGPSLAKAYAMEVMQTIKEILKLNPFFKEQMQMILERTEVHEAGKLADFGAALTTAEPSALQEVLGTLNVVERIEKTLLLLKKELELSKLQSEISKSVEDKMSANQRRYMLMEQLKLIKKELGLERDDKEALTSKFTERIAQLEVPEEARKVIDEEILKLQSLEPSSSEFNVTRNYLDWLTALPWGKYSPEDFELARAESVLEADHYGLEDIKERIMEFIAVGALCGTTQGKILCFVGPPGVGKTSIGKSIASALNREFFRFSVGGLTDVAEIKGHRRTYVGAMPGKLIQCLKSTSTANPVVLIDEIDKLGRGYTGDPSSALLEVLDPSQNSTFLDHYLDVAVDLSKVLFLCTANDTSTIPGPLLDRMEVVRLSGYVLDEKVEIARRYLEPAARKQMGMLEEHMRLTDEAVEELIRWYCREAGVRNLQKHIEKICRKVALKVVRRQQEEAGAVTAAAATEAQATQPSAAEAAGCEPTGVTLSGGTAEERAAVVVQQVVTPGKRNAADESLDEAAAELPAAEELSSAPAAVETIVVAKGDLADYVGKPPFQSERIYEANPPGVVTGLAWTSMGGAMLYIEVQPVGPTRGMRSGGAESDGDGEGDDRSGGSGAALRHTGQMGDVMRESTSIAHTFARGYLHRLQPDNPFLESNALHVHVPEGATPKDGPSAGITMVTAMLSLALGKPPRADLAMTGELSLTGRVLPIGGVKEKTIAAQRAGIKRVIFPKANKRDFDELADNLREGITAHFAEQYEEVYKIAFGESD